MAFFGSSRRVARRTARRTSRRWGMWNQMAQQGPWEQEEIPQVQGQSQQTEDPVKVLQIR
jgi:hypothetical protein